LLRKLLGLRCLLTNLRPSYQMKIVSTLIIYDKTWKTVWITNESKMNLSEVCDAFCACQTKKKILGTEIMANSWNAKNIWNTYITSKISRNYMNISSYFEHVIGYARFTLRTLSTIQVVSKIRVLILNWFKICNKLAIKMYTRLWVRANIFCCDIVGAANQWSSHEVFT
jgi:hypothetical protein